MIPGFFIRTALRASASRARVGRVNHLARWSIGLPVTVLLTPALPRRRKTTGGNVGQLPPNNAFKPTPHRGANHMAGTACHVLHAPLRRGLTLVLGGHGADCLRACRSASPPTRGICASRRVQRGLGVRDGSSGRRGNVYSTQLFGFTDTSGLATAAVGSTCFGGSVCAWAVSRSLTHRLTIRSSRNRFAVRLNSRC